jgi:hypothetical protein
MTALDDLKAKYLTAVSGAADEGALEEVRLAALGKKGEISLKMRELGQMSAEERQTTGAALNRLKDEIDLALRARMAGRDPARAPAPDGDDSPGFAGHGRTDRDFCRYGLCRGRRPAGGK